MAKAYVFPGQGAQFVGMGKDLYESNEQAKALFEKANEILGFRITDLMFNGTEDDLKQTLSLLSSSVLSSQLSALTLSQTWWLVTRLVSSLLWL